MPATTARRRVKAPRPAAAHFDVADISRPEATDFLRDVFAGLSGEPKSLPCKYLYDVAGSALFDRICELPEYYPTRTEQAIFDAHAGEIAAAVGPEAALVEFGSGSSTKTRTVLDACRESGGPAAYVPLDISREHLLASAEELRCDYPDLAVVPVVADFTEPVRLPELPPHARKVVFFPGSTLGNFSADTARDLLARIGALVGPGGGLILGLDLKKDPAVLEAAYDDAAGVTAAFTSNLLVRINRELGGDFVPAAFRHVARWNEADGRVELFQVSERDQTVTVAGRSFTFEAGEPIHVENSHKYDPDGIADLAGAAGWEVARTWTDAGKKFAVVEMERAG